MANFHFPSLMVAAGVGAALLSGCGQPPVKEREPARPEAIYRPPPTVPDNLTPEMKANMLMERFANVPCVKSQITAGDVHSLDPVVRAKADQFEDWYNHAIFYHPDVYPPVSEEHQGDGWTGIGWKGLTRSYAYTEDGVDMELRFSKTWGSTIHNINRQMIDVPYKQAEIVFCAWVPGHVEILSENGSTSSGWIGVQYEMVWKQTEIGTLMGRSGGYQASAPQAVRGAASLERRGPMDWVVHYS